MLIARGLRVDDRAGALQIIRRINYYRLSGYWHPFKNPDDTFKPDASFEKAIEFYQFDRELRLAVMDMLERVEVGIRCSMSNYLALKYGTYCHEDARNFSPAFEHAKWLHDLHVDTDRSKEKFIDHFRNDYIEYPILPVWVAAEVMSFGTLSFMYKGLNGFDQAELAKPFGVNKVVVQSWLHTLAFVRNICAHHSRLWNRELSVAPKFPYVQSWKPPAIPNPKAVYSVLCILRHLSVGEPCGDKWRMQTVGLLERWDAEPRWRKAMGIPVDWKSSVFWSSELRGIR